MAYTIIADSGATKCEWTIIGGAKKKTIFTIGISPYFLSKPQIVELVSTQVAQKLTEKAVENVFFYGTGLSNAENAAIMKKVLKTCFPKAKVEVGTDLLAAARALCGTKKGIACILGTGSNSGFYNGKKIVKNSPGIGYVLGDEGSGAYLGKKVVQYFLYETFDAELTAQFNDRFKVSRADILNAVYKQPFPSRYLAGFAMFLAENRGHYMVENILEDGLNDFFFQHIYKYTESWSLPIHFVGSVAHGFKDVLKDLCNSYELELGTVLKSPMPGLIQFHKHNAAK